MSTEREEFSAEAEADIKAAAELVDKLARPIYVFRLARGMLPRDGEFLERPGNRKRLVNASRQILAIFSEKAKHDYGY
jgi:hypothetical protein